MEEQQNKSSKPIWSKKLGFVELAIWQKSVNDSKFYDVKLTRSYKDKEGKWQHSETLGEGDISNAVVLLSKAQEWVLSQK